MELAGTDEPQIGDVVDGVIDGTTSEGGYLVTMKFGSQVLKGVLYHHAKRPQQAMGTHLQACHQHHSAELRRKPERLLKLILRNPNSAGVATTYFLAKK